MQRILGGAVIGAVAGGGLGLVRARRAEGRKGLAKPVVLGALVGVGAGFVLEVRHRGGGAVALVGDGALAVVGRARPVVDRATSQAVERIVERAVDAAFDAVTDALVAAKNEAMSGRHDR